MDEQIYVWIQIFQKQQSSCSLLLFADSIRLKRLKNHRFQFFPTQSWPEKETAAVGHLYQKQRRFPNYLKSKEQKAPEALFSSANRLSTVTAAERFISALSSRSTDSQGHSLCFLCEIANCWLPIRKHAAVCVCVCSCWSCKAIYLAGICPPRCGISSWFLWSSNRKDFNN